MLGAGSSPGFKSRTKRVFACGVLSTQSQQGKKKKDKQTNKQKCWDLGWGADWQGTWQDLISLWTGVRETLVVPEQSMKNLLL